MALVLLPGLNNLIEDISEEKKLPAQVVETALREALLKGYERYRRTLYIGINLIGGERGLISYFDKKNTYEKLIEEEKVLTAKLKDLDHKISLINKNDPDYLDMLYRQKFNYVTEDEIIIKLK